jgi:general secretion pathway protein G
MPVQTMREDRAAGFSIIELLFVMGIILTLASLAMPQLQSAIDKARYTRAVSEITAMGQQAIAYDASEQEPPNSLDDIGCGGWQDPWGNPYRYVNLTNPGAQPRTDRFGVPINTDFDLYSMGPDEQTSQSITDSDSLDDVIWASDGTYVGWGADY